MVSTPSPASQDCAAPLAGLLQPEVVAEMLRCAIPLAAAPPVQEIRIERFWPAGKERFTIQWSFQMDGHARYSLFGRVPATADQRDLAAKPDTKEAGQLTPAGLRRVFRYLPQWDALVHSSDCDPDLPHLPRCLTADAAQSGLAKLPATQSPDECGEPRVVECRLLGYKPARRATIAYLDGRVHPAAPCLLGKTFRDDRGRRLLDRHARLNTALQAVGGGKVQVLRPLAYVAAHQLALFAWAPGRAFGTDGLPIHEAVNHATDALIALHQVRLTDLPNFTAADEAGILQQWHAALLKVHPGAGGATGAVLGKLLDEAAAPALTAQQACTVHRDFYETQFVADGPTTTLLDLDTLCCGDPCLDLGNFLGHLLLSRLRTAGSLHGFESLASAAVARYAQACGAIDHQALQFYLSSTLFRLGAIHAMRTQTQRYAPQLWGLAEQPPPIH